MKKLIPQAQAIIAMAHLIDQHDGQDLIKKLMAKNLRSATGLYFDQHEGTLSGTAYSVGKSQDPKSPGRWWTYRMAEKEAVAQTVQRVQDELQKAYGADWRVKLRTFQAFDALFNHHYFKRSPDGNTKFHANGRYDSALGYLLDYLVNDQMPENYQRAHEQWEEGTETGGKRNKLNVIGTHTSEMVPGITVKIYQNGRIDIKGLTATQQDKLDALINLNREVKAVTFLTPQYA